MRSVTVDDVMSLNPCDEYPRGLIVWKENEMEGGSV